MALSLLVLYCPGLSTPEQVTPNSNRVCVCVCCRAMLSSIYDEVCVVDILDSGDTAHLALMKRPDLGVTFTKLHCWTLTHYTKCVFMDADTLVSIRALTLLTQYKLQQVCIKALYCVCVRRCCPTSMSCLRGRSYLLRLILVGQTVSTPACLSLNHPMKHTAAL